MQLFYSSRFEESFTGAPVTIQKAFYKQAGLLESNIRHPSLKAKKYDESRNLWQARVTLSWRFYFQVKGNLYFLIDITKHPK